MAKKGFKEGEKVHHKFGGPPFMYVVSQNKKTGNVTCQWFTSTGQFQEVVFDSNSLAKYKEPPIPPLPPFKVVDAKAIELE